MAQLKTLSLRWPSAHRPAPVPSLPYAHLNLRRNPFGELELADRARLAVVEVERWVPRLEEPGFALQFLGPPGHGKTTHLLALLRRFPGAAYVHVGERERPGIPRAHPLFMDEIQRLPARRRRSILRRRLSLAVATHEDLSAELVRAGFAVETVSLAAALDAERLHAILNRRIEWARRGPGKIPQMTIETARAVFRCFGGDVRAVLGHMYDLFQRLGEVCDV